MKVGQIMGAVRGYLEHAGNEVIPREQILQWLNLSRVEIGKKWPFDYLYQEATRNTQANKSRYGLPPDFSYFGTVLYEGSKLYKWDGQFFDELLGTGDARLPVYTELYVIRGTEIELVQPPTEDDKTVTLRYYSVPADFINDNEYDYITVNHPLACIYGTVFQGAAYLMDSEKISLYGMMFQRQVDELIQHESSAHKQDDRTRVLDWRDIPLDQLRKGFKLRR